MKCTKAFDEEMLRRLRKNVTDVVKRKSISDRLRSLTDIKTTSSHSVAQIEADRWEESYSEQSKMTFNMNDLQFEPKELLQL